MLMLEQITDVSGLKWSEIQLRKRMDQAIEMKKQQERYMASLGAPFICLARHFFS